MNESTAQANGQAPVEHLVAVEDMLRPMVIREVARQLAVDPEPLWLSRTRSVMSWAAMLSVLVIAVLSVTGMIR